MQQGSGNSYLPTENYAYVQGSEQRTSQTINLSLPTIVNQNLENSADGPSEASTSSGSRSVGSMIDLNAPYTAVNCGLQQDLGSTSAGNSSLQNQLCSCGRMREVPEEASENVQCDENALYSQQVDYCPCQEISTQGGSSGSLNLPGSASVLPDATSSNAVAFLPSPITTIAHAPLSHINTYTRRVEAHLDFIPGTSYSALASAINSRFVLSTHLPNVSGTNYFSSWSPSRSTMYQPAIIPRNYFSFWLPAAPLANALAPVLPIMHAPSSVVPLPHSPWNWTYSSIQVPSMYPINGTIGNEVILHQDSLPLVPIYQFPQLSLVPGAERVITGVNMVNSNLSVQQLNFPVIHTPRFRGDYFWHLPFLRGVNHAPGPIPLHPYNFHMAQNGGGMPQTFYIDTDNMSYEGLLAFQNRVGYVSTGLSKEVICARLKSSKYQPVEKSEDDNDMCIICLDDYCDGQSIGFSDCGHKFHFDCFTEWLMQNNSCPFCRRTALTI